MTDMAAPADAWAGAVLLHPHPSYGGDRFNVVVEALWRACAAAGVAAARFDFASDDIGAGVTDAVDALDSLPPGVPLAVAGYSFGAIVAAHIVDPRLVGWALIAPPLRGTAPIAADARPKLVLEAEHDQFGPPALDGWRAVQHEVLRGADHFLAGSTAGAADRVIGWLRSTATPGGR